MISREHLLCPAAVAAALVLVTCGAAAQSTRTAKEYPSKPIRWIVPFAPGGSADILSRVIAQRITEHWGQQIVVDFRPGAGGILGTKIAANAPADGYTVVLVPSTFTSSPSLYRKPPYDPVKDFAPVSLVATSPLILVVPVSLPVKSVSELVALAKAKPGELNYASSGVGVAAHMAGELLKSMAKVDIIHISYKGNAPALQGLLGGQVHMMFSNAPSALPHVKAGKLRAVAVSTLKRCALVPDIPTVAESGFPRFDANNWGGLLAPANTPKAIVSELQNEISRVTQLPEVKAKLVNYGFEVVGNTSEAFQSYIREEIAKWAAVIKEAGIRAD